MKLLIGGSSSKFFHLKDFADELENIGIECKLVHDTDFADSQRHFGLEALNNEVPLFVYLRGNYL